MSTQLPSKEEGRGCASEDHFSKLPHDCLLDVFSRVDRKTLNECEFLNRELHSVVNHTSLGRIKTDGKLFVYEQRSGHAFALNVESDTQYCCLSYRIDRGSSAGARARSAYLYDENYAGRCHKSKEPCFPDYCTGIGKEDVIEKGTATSVPAELFGALSKLFERHSSRDIMFQWTRVDTHFLRHFAELDCGSNSFESKKTFSFMHATFDDAMEPEHFAQFLLGSNLSSLSIINPLANVAKLEAVFNEDFLTRFAEQIPSHIAPEFCFTVFSKPTLYWTPSAEFLQVLCRFNYFELLNMRLDGDAFARLIMMRFDLVHSTESVKWTFSLTDCVRPEHMVAIDDSEEYSHYKEVYRLLGDDWRTIEREGAPFLCRYQEQYGENDEVTVEVVFNDVIEDAPWEQSDDEEFWAEHDEAPMRD